MNHDLLGFLAPEKTCSLTWEMGCNFLNHFQKRMEEAEKCYEFF